MKIREYSILMLIFISIQFIGYVTIYSLLNTQSKYNYLDWVYYFYTHANNIVFYYYLYFIFTTSVFFMFILFAKIFKKTNDEEKI